MKKLVLLLLATCVGASLTGCATTTPTETVAPTTTVAMTVQPTATVMETPTMAPTIEPTSTQMMEPTMMPSDMSVEGVADGTYTARQSEKFATDEGHGWQGYLTITVKSEAITKAEFDYLKDGEKKSEQSAEAYPMTPPPSEWIPMYNEAVMKAVDTGLIDTVTGATESAKEVNELYAAVLDAAKKGEKEVTLP